jgi:signal transduction histidine kinase
MSDKNSIICIIEDNPEDQEVFRRYLLQDMQYSYQCYVEESGEKGLELCRMVRPDCILLDYKLPDMDGLEFLAGLADETGSIPYAVIMLAGLSSKPIALQAMKDGAQDYLVKDEMTPGNLLRAIHNAIERTSMRRTLEQQRRVLEQKNQEMEAFAYALAHDLRAPLRSITGFSQILHQDYRTSLDEEGRHFVDTIVHSCVQMDRLIEDLLNYTRIEHRAVRSKPIALGYCMQQIIEGLSARIAAEHATVTIADDLPTIFGDSTLIHQIFVNLIENALTYARPGVPAQVTLHWQRDDTCAVLSLCDNGIGIAPKHYERIFRIFQRLHGEDVYPGTGIGLAIVKKATDLLDGQVWIKSVVGEGSTFFVRLPLYIT